MNEMNQMKDFEYFWITLNIENLIEVVKWGEGVGSRSHVFFELFKLVKTILNVFKTVLKMY